MAIPLKQSTASQEVPLGYFVDSTDGNTEKTALTIANTDIKVWKNGATSLANKNSGGATHISNGIYYAVLDATDTDTLGPLVLFVHVSGALTVRLECVVHPAAVFDALYGSATLPADVTKWNGTAVATPATAGYPAVTLKSGTGTGEISLSSGAVTAGSLATQAKTDVKDQVVAALSADTYAEPGSVPSATATLAAKLGWLYTLARNRRTTTSSTESLRNDGDSANIATATVADDGTTFSRAKWS